jgi:cellulose synthase/poly-beta-1,6-N-acetylglucosamine synthase-like glycosyltransferase
MNNKLSIAIPTYNRDTSLYKNIKAMLPILNKFQIPVYISDDSNNEKTLEIVNKLKSEYQYIFYEKNFTSLGHDRNCIKTLNMPIEEYIWYLGDSKYITSEGIENIYNIINNNSFDFILVS